MQPASRRQGRLRGGSPSAGTASLFILRESFRMLLTAHRCRRSPRSIGLARPICVPSLPPTDLRSFRPAIASMRQEKLSVTCPCGKMTPGSPQFQEDFIMRLAPAPSRTRSPPESPRLGIRSRGIRWRRVLHPGCSSGLHFRRSSGMPWRGSRWRRFSGSPPRATRAGRLTLPPGWVGLPSGCSLSSGSGFLISADSPAGS